MVVAKGTMICCQYFQTKETKKTKITHVASKMDWGTNILVEFYSKILPIITNDYPLDV